MLHTGAVILYGMIPQPVRLVRKGTKSLRGQFSTNLGFKPQIIQNDFPRYYLKEDSGPQANYITTDRV
jgi:hypothetical protein